MCHIIQMVIFRGHTSIQNQSKLIYKFCIHILVNRICCLLQEVDFLQASSNIEILQSNVTNILHVIYYILCHYGCSKNSAQMGAVCGKINKSYRCASICRRLYWNMKIAACYTWLLHIVFLRTYNCNFAQLPLSIFTKL